MIISDYMYDTEKKCHRNRMPSREGAIRPHRDPMPQSRLTNIGDLGQDLLGLVFERLPMHDRAQLEAVSKNWREICKWTAWRHISYRSDTKEKLLAFLDWLYSHVGQRRPEAVQTIQLRLSGLGKIIHHSILRPSVACKINLLHICIFKHKIARLFVGLSS